MWLARYDRYRTLLSNVGYLSILQGVNLIVPLITLPYLLRVLGAEVYGLVAFAQSVVSYLVILVSFGFSITAVKEVSLNRNNPRKLSEVVSSVYIIKGILLVLSLSVVLLLSMCFETIAVNKSLVFLCMWMCIYDFLFPEWYFQGIEKMKYITLITTVFRIIFVVLIFLLVKDEGDYLLIPIINGIGAIVAGSIGVYILFFLHKIKLVFPGFSTLRFYLKESFPIFIYKSTQLYIKLNKAIIGVFIGMSEVAYYDLAEKIVSVLKMPISILAQSVFPKNVKEKRISFIKKSFYYIMILNLFIIVILLIFIKPLLKLVGGEEMLEAVPIVMLLIFTVIPISFNSLIASQVLLGFNFKNKYVLSVVSAGVIYGVTILIMYIGGFWTLLGVGTAVLLAELTTSCVSYYFIKKLNLTK